MLKKIPDNGEETSEEYWKRFQGMFKKIPENVSVKIYFILFRTNQPVRKENEIIASNKKFHGL